MRVASIALLGLSAIDVKGNGAESPGADTRSLRSPPAPNEWRWSKPTTHPVKTWAGWNGNKWDSWSWGKPTQPPVNAWDSSSWSSGKGPSYWVLHGWGGDVWTNNHAWTGDGWSPNKPVVVPTPAPSSASSQEKTQQPTQKPTQEKTQQPSQEKTEEPSEASRGPSTSPSSSSSLVPSEFPSNNPSGTPPQSVLATSSGNITITVEWPIENCGYTTAVCNRIFCEGLLKALRDELFPNGADNDYQSGNVGLTCDPETETRPDQQDFVSTTTNLVGKSAIAFFPTEVRLVIQCDVTDPNCEDEVAQAAAAAAAFVALPNVESLPYSSIKQGISDVLALLDDPQPDPSANEFFAELTFSYDGFSLGPPVILPIPDDIPGFKLFGGGDCLDINGDWFSYFSYKETVENERECAIRCNTSPCFTTYDWILVGMTFEVYTRGNYCGCHFRSLIDMYEIQREDINECMGGQGYADFARGPTNQVGTVAGTTDDGRYTCYEVEGVPSLKVPGFELVGQGYCVDIDGKDFSEIVFNVTTIQDCANECNTASCLSEDYEWILVGMDIRTPDFRCSCLFINHSFSEKTKQACELEDNFEKLNFVIENAGGVAGTSPSNTLGYNCYKVVE